MVSCKVFFFPSFCFQIDLSREQLFQIGVLRRMLFVLVVLSVSLVSGARCTVLTDADELASLTAAGYTCSSPGVSCDDSTGTCHVIAMPGMCVVLVLFVVFLMFLKFCFLPSSFGQDQFPVAGQDFEFYVSNFFVSFCFLWIIIFLFQGGQLQRSFEQYQFPGFDQCSGFFVSNLFCLILFFFCFIIFSFAVMLASIQL